jgi:hypothetical protein
MIPQMAITEQTAETTRVMTNLNQWGIIKRTKLGQMSTMMMTIVVIMGKRRVMLMAVAAALVTMFIMLQGLAAGNKLALKRFRKSLTVPTQLMKWKRLRIDPLAVPIPNEQG